MLAQLSIAAPSYEVIQIGNRPGYETGLPMAINNRNVVVGNSWNGGQNDAWLYSEVGGMVSYGTSAYTARDLNDDGESCGFMEGWKSGSRAKLGMILGWGQPNGYVRSEAWGINSLGEMVGWATDTNSLSRANRFNLGFSHTLLPVLNPATDSMARRVNSAGTAVGMSDNKAVLWTANNTLVNLHSMIPGAVDSFSSDINEAGWVTGYFTNALNERRSFMFNFESGMTVFDPLPNNAVIVSRALNLHGDAVGFSVRSINGGILEGFVRFNGKSAVSLNSLIDPNSGWNLSEATDINDNGYIIGRGTFQGVNTNFLMRPVPEPATLMALGSGLAFLIRSRRKTR
jgi:hypothetical protein